MSWQTWAIGFSVFGIVQFLVLTTTAMYMYPGGILHDASTEGYSFLYNFFSDLGRTRALNRMPNTYSRMLFVTALSLTGISMAGFFMILPALFTKTSARLLAVLAMMTGMVAGLCYIGIGYYPLNGSYWTHRFFVRTGFIAFWGCMLLYASAIWREPSYPNRYATYMLLFALVLLLQIGVMFFGPRSWQSPAALWLQVVSQKVIVYAQLLCMLVQTAGAHSVLKLRNRDA